MPSVVLHSTIRQIPPDSQGGHELETAEISAEAETYEAAFEALRAQVPDGWQLLGVSRW